MVRNAGYIVTLGSSFGRRSSVRNTGYRELQHYFIMMLAGWLTYSTVYAWFDLAPLVGVRDISPAWNHWAIEAFLRLTLFGVTYAVAVRTVPFFLYHARVIAPPRGWGYIYILFTTLALVLQIPTLTPLTPPSTYLLDLAQLLSWSAVAVLIWKLRVFNEFRSPDKPARLRSPTWLNPSKWGRAEALIYASYLWLTLAVLLELYRNVSALLHWPALFAEDIPRHAFLLGFVTQLIFGMGQKMVPGFLHRKESPRPSLVAVSFVFLNLAAIGRVLALLPGAWTIVTPAARTGSAMLFGLSGSFALLAFIFFAWNLVDPRRLVKIAPPASV